MVPPVGSVLGNVKGRLPGSLERRIRWSFALFAVLVVVLSVIGLASVDTPAWPQQVVAALVLVGLAGHAWVMWLLGDVIRTHDRATRREAVLAGAASRMQHARDHDTIYDVAVHAALEMVDEVPDVGVTLWRGDRRTLHIGDVAGDVPSDMPLEVSLATVPDDLRRSLLAGKPFALDVEESAIVQRAVGLDPVLTSILIAPLSHGDSFSGALAIGSRGPLPDELVASLGRIGADVGLALDRADSTALLATVVDSSSDAILLLDHDLVIDLASHAVTGLLGYQPDELVGRDARELFSHTADLAQVLEQAASASELRDPEVMSMRQRDGSLRSIELAAGRLVETGRRGWVVNLRDVTRRVRTEQALRHSEQRFRSLAENVTEGLYRMVLHPEARFEYVNPAMEVMTGFPFERFLEDPELTLNQTHPDDRHLIERTRTDPASIVWPVEIRWWHPERGWRWASIRESVAYGSDGRPLSSMGIVSDVTARKQEEQALRNALDKERRVTEELRRVDIMKTTFLQAVSHELRTPLTAITGYAQTLNRGGSQLEGGTVNRLLDRLEANAAKLDRLLTDLLDLDRMSSVTIQPLRRPVDVADLCRRVIDQIEQTTHVVTCTQTARTAEVDPAKVERIVENLVRNAIKYTDPGTPVTVDVVPDRAGDGVVITVEDQGPGIPEDLHESIFTPFVQGPDSATAAKPGTGIGLALVARFAELHGGRAWIEQAAERGSRFHVWLPSSTTDARGLERAPSGDERPASEGGASRLLH